MEPEALANQLNDLAARAQNLADNAAHIAQQSLGIAGSAGAHGDFFITGLTVLILACFVGYYVVWRVTPALHSPLMAVTNAISSVVIVGAVIAAGPVESSPSKWLGFFAVILAAINIFGGFGVAGRMIAMFRKDA